MNKPTHHGSQIGGTSPRIKLRRRPIHPDKSIIPCQFTDGRTTIYDLSFGNTRVYVLGAQERNRVSSEIYGALCHGFTVIEKRFLRRSIDIRKCMCACEFIGATLSHDEFDEIMCSKIQNQIQGLITRIKFRYPDYFETSSIT